MQENKISSSINYELLINELNEKATLLKEERKRLETLHKKEEIKYKEAISNYSLVNSLIDETKLLLSKIKYNNNDKIVKKFKLITTLSIILELILIVISCCNTISIQALSNFFINMNIIPIVDGVNLFIINGLISGLLATSISIIITYVTSNILNKVTSKSLDRNISKNTNSKEYQIILEKINNLTSKKELITENITKANNEQISINKEINDIDHKLTEINGFIRLAETWKKDKENKVPRKSLILAKKENITNNK